MYKGSNNPWPFTTVLGAGETRFGYGTRPVVEWRMPSTPQKYYDSNGIETTMPKLIKLKNRAIVADLAITQAQVLTRHKSGINVMYGTAGPSGCRRRVHVQGQSAQGGKRPSPLSSRAPENQPVRRTTASLQEADGTP